jgi:hypothetical protein
MFQNEDTSSMAKSRPPTGAPKAEAIPVRRGHLRNYYNFKYTVGLQHIIKYYIINCTTGFGLP